MKWLARGVIGVLALAVLLAVIGLVLPGRAHVERAVEIAAPPATVFEYVDGMRATQAWSPWLAQEPKAERRFTGPEVGPGSRLEWSGRKIGRGSQTIIAAQPYSKVTSKLAWGGGSPAVVTFTITPAGEGSRVNWALDSDLGWNPVARWFGLFFDRLVGPDFEHGLANLRKVAEAAPRADLAAAQIKLVELTPQTIAYVPGQSSLNAHDLSAAFAAAFGQDQQFLTANNLKPAGFPLAITVAYDPKANRYAYEAGIPFTGTAPAQANGPVQVEQTYGGTAVQAIHVGSYDQTAGTYAAIDLYLRIHHLEQAGRSWEEYVSDPGMTPVEQLITRIYFPVRPRAGG